MACKSCQFILYCRYDMCISVYDKIWYKLAIIQRESLNIKLWGIGQAHRALEWAGCARQRMRLAVG
jgi:hypothetical protein